MSLRRRPPKKSVDANQAALVVALEAAGHKVEDLSGAGNGVPDLMVGVRTGEYRRIILLEVKRPLTDHRGGVRGVSPSDVELTPAQEVFHRKWKGFPVYVVSTPERALQICGGPPSPPAVGLPARPTSLSSPSSVEHFPFSTEDAP